jgi:preprotein translocase subunit SecE
MINKITQFIREVRLELGKVSWSTREELIGSTAVVFILTLIIAVFVFIIDSGLAQFLSTVFKS